MFALMRATKAPWRLKPLYEAGSRVRQSTSPYVHTEGNSSGSGLLQGQHNCNKPQVDSQTFRQWLAEQSLRNGLE